MTMSLDQLYEKYVATPSPIAEHLPRLRELASGCRSAVEIGVKWGRSSVALLLGCPDVTSYDIVETPQARKLKEVAPWWKYIIADSRSVEPNPCDMLFIDSLHTYDQLKAELDIHGSSAQRLIAFHDTITFGVIGADGETGKHDPKQVGIRLAIDEFMISRPEWRIHAHHPNSHGLLVLRRYP